MHALRYGRQAGWLFQTAMLVFLVTIGLGMARGLGIIDFEDRNQVLTHLHSGTIGWITLGIMASALVLYSTRDDRPAGSGFLTWTCQILVIGVPTYIVAWWTGNLPFRAIAGSFLLLGIILFVGWLVREAARIGYRNLTTPQLAAVVGLVTLVVGSAIGVTLQIQFASKTSVLPGDPVGAHAETQISAYLVLVAMSFAYWGLRGNDRTTRGTWMIWLFFIAGAIIATSLLADVFELSILFVPFDVVAITLFLTVTWRRVLAPGWTGANATRHFAVAIPFALFYFGMFVFIIVGFAGLQLWDTFEDIPANFIPAAEHPLFVGMVTNILFGVLFTLNRGRRDIWPWADHVVFWGLNLSVAAFTLAILFNGDDLFKFITPVLGLSIFTGIVTHTMRLQMNGSGSMEAMGVAGHAG